MIVAFMQNPWFPQGTAEKHIIRYRDDQDFHRRLLANTMSGRRLREAFRDWFDKIWWDNADWHPDWYLQKLRADQEHIIQVIEMCNPELVISFGSIANEAIGLICIGHFPELPHLRCHHPNARHKTQHDLDIFAQDVRISYQRIKQTK